MSIQCCATCHQVFEAPVQSSGCDPGTAQDLALGTAANGQGDMLGHLKDAGYLNLRKPNYNPAVNGWSAESLSVLG